MLIKFWNIFKAQRKFEVRKVICRFPDKVPLIIERRYSVDIPKVRKSRFLAPLDLTIGQLIFIVRTRMCQSFEHDIYLYVDDRMLQLHQLVGDIYPMFKDREDGFLYLSYSNKKPLDLYLDLFTKKRIILLIFCLIILIFLFFFIIFGFNENVGNEFRV